MSIKITCYTLFDITQSGVLNRSRPGVDVDIKEWTYKRNTQCNFDTILQVISLRSQPDVISSPEKLSIQFDKFDKFGFMYQQIEKEFYPCWKFTFEVQHPSVFDNGTHELGALYYDCDQVPMILCQTEMDKLSNFLDTTPELRNIYFKINHEQ